MRARNDNSTPPPATKEKMSVPGGPDATAWPVESLGILLEALGSPDLSESELALLAWIARQEPATVQNLADLIRRSRGGDCAATTEEKGN